MFLKKISIEYLDKEFKICPFCKRLAKKINKNQYTNITFYCYCEESNTNYLIDIYDHQITFFKLKFIRNMKKYFFIFNDTLRCEYNTIEILNEDLNQVLSSNKNKLDIDLPEENILDFLQNLIYKKSNLINFI